MAQFAATVVVPTRMRAAALGRCLGALEALEPVGGGHEVVVVADGPTPGIATVVERARRRGLPVRLVEQERTGAAGARNRGAQLAAGDVVAFTDDDCLPQPGWLRAVAGALANQPDVLVGGPVKNALPSNPYAEASQLVAEVVVGHLATRGSALAFFTSNNLALRRETLMALGGFDIRFPGAAAEDRDLCERAHAAGHVLVAVPEAVVEHAHELDLRRLCCQQFGYGRGAAMLRRSRVTRATIHPRFDARLYLAIARAATAEPGRARRLALVALTQLVYAAGLVAGSHGAT